MWHQCLLCAHQCRSIGQLRFAKADIACADIWRFGLGHAASQGGAGARKFARLKRWDQPFTNADDRRPGWCPGRQFAVGSADEGNSSLAQAITWSIDWPSCSLAHINGMIARLNTCTAISGGADRRRDFASRCAKDGSGSCTLCPSAARQPRAERWLRRAQSGDVFY